MSHLIAPKELDVETTTEELEALMIVKTVLRTKIQTDRIVYGDAKTYFAILLDGNSRKTICRLYLGRKKKFIGLVNSRKVETRNEIQSIDDIFGYAEDLMTTVMDYDN